MVSKVSKVYGGCYDGKTRLVVAASTKKQAFEAVKAVFGFSLSYSNWDSKTAVSANEIEVQLTSGSEGVVYKSTSRVRVDATDYTAA
jgi:hypothetical protein